MSFALLFSLFGTLAPVLGLQAAAPSAAEPALQHTPPPCMDTETFPLIEVLIGASERPRRLFVHFKSDSDTGWYTADLSSTAGATFQGALPKPLPEAVRVVYFIESDRDGHRTPEYAVNVLMGGCPGARAAPEELRANLRVRRTASGQDEIPAGFSSDGLEREGRPSRTTLGILAGAAGGAGVAALVIAGDEPVPPPTDGGNPTALRACFTPDPIPDIESGDTVRFDASCTTPGNVTTFQWSFGDGATATGSSVEHLFEPGGVYTVSLTVGDGVRTDNKSRLVQVRATPTACFITSPDPPRITANESINFNADCSVGDQDGGSIAITSYVWDFGDGRPSAEGRFVSRQFPRPDLYGVTLTVTNEDGRQDKTTQFVVVERPGTGSSRTGVTFTTELGLAPGAAAQISLNDSLGFAASAPSPMELRAQARGGENVLDGRLLSETNEPGRWRFDFRNAANFVPGSLRVDRGEVLTLDSYSVVFRVMGESPTVRFRFLLED